MLHPSNPTGDSMYWNSQQQGGGGGGYPPPYLYNPGYPPAPTQYPQHGAFYPNKYDIPPTNYFQPEKPPINQYIPPEYLPRPPDKMRSSSRLCARLMFVLVMVFIILFSALNVIRTWIVIENTTLIVEIGNVNIVNFNATNPSVFVWEAEIQMKNPFWYSTLQFDNVSASLLYKEQLVSHLSVGQFNLDTLEQINFVVTFNIDHVPKDAEWVRNLRNSSGAKFNFTTSGDVTRKIGYFWKPGKTWMSASCQGLDSSSYANVQREYQLCDVNTAL